MAAIKVIAPEFSRDRALRERFARESRMARAVDHPNIVRVREAGEVDGLLYILMQYIEGRDLRAVIEDRGRLAPGRAVEIISEVASALDAAHSQGLLHRDVKPANILIADADGQAYLADFGLAVHAGSLTRMTRSGHWVGTVDYLAPERSEGKAEDARTDVYSLGCVLYQAITGALPFPMDSDMATMYAHVNRPAPAPHAVTPELPAAFDEVIGRALAKNPADRYPSAGELATSAVGALRGERAVPIADVGTTREGQMLPQRPGDGTAERSPERSLADRLFAFFGVARGTPQGARPSKAPEREDTDAPPAKGSTRRGSSPPVVRPPRGATEDSSRGRGVKLASAVTLLVLLGGGAAAYLLTASSQPIGAPRRAIRVVSPLTTTSTAAQPAGAEDVSLSLRPSAAVYVCLIDNDNGRKLIPGLELKPGSSTPTYHAKRFTITLGNSSVTMFVDGTLRTVAPSSAAIGYSVTKTGRQRLKAGQLPTCA
jgi:serine/threonine-protein kinase